MVRRKSARRQRAEEDPMAGTSNLVDAMLVIAVGFLVFVIISWNMTAMVTEDAKDGQVKVEMRIFMPPQLNWFEHLTYNRKGLGSCPRGGTNIGV